MVQHARLLDAAAEEADRVAAAAEAGRAAAQAKVAMGARIAEATRVAQQGVEPKSRVAFKWAPP